MFIYCHTCCDQYLDLHKVFLPLVLECLLFLVNQTDSCIPFDTSLQQGSLVYMLMQGCSLALRQSCSHVHCYAFGLKFSFIVLSGA